MMEALPAGAEARVGDWSVVFDSEFQQFVNELLHAERGL
jgi:hypothetical protein